MRTGSVIKFALATSLISLSMAQPALAGVNLTGAGSTFAIPLLDSCKAGFSATTGNSYTYTGGGSGAGRSASDNGIGDFNFSDTPHTASSRKATVIHIPIIAAPIAVMYNAAGISKLNLSLVTIAGIFAGTISKWNDPAILADNARAKFPNEKIHVIYRADSSGTSGNLTAFLHNLAPKQWPKPANNSFATSFPGQLNSMSNLGRVVSASGSSALAVLAKKTPFSVTYAEKSYATAARLKVANIKNAAGNFQPPDALGTSTFLGSATATSSGILTLNYKTKAAHAYPLGVVAYALVDTKTKRASAVKSFLKYVLSPKCADGVRTLGYSTISGSLLKLNNSLIAKIG